MFKFGFELEAWCISDIDEGLGVEPRCVREVPNAIPRDGCGYLVEFRGEPHTKPLFAKYLLDAERHRVGDHLALYHLMYATCDARVKLLPKFKRAMLYKHGKNAGKASCIYGELKEKYNDPYSYAGLHIHISKTGTVNGVECSIPFDHVPIIKHLDKTFSSVIKEAGRQPGLYCIKPYGFEYRSLPCTVSLTAVVRALEELNLNGRI